VGDEGGNDRIEFELDALASLRLRAGIAADRALIYVTGGLAYASGEFTVIDDAGPGQDTGSVDLDSFGGVVGGGAAFAISDNASLRLEGLYYIFDDEKDTSDLTSDSDDGDSLSLEDVFVIRAGLDWRF
jgi:outer membrane immunogenic protein